MPDSRGVGGEGRVGSQDTPGRRAADPSADVAAAMRPPRAVLDIARRLEAAGHETWCVGGAIRDTLLGHPHTDWDLATAATPEQVQRLFGRRTVPVGVAHGTVGVLDPRGTMHEVTTFRRDVRTDGRHADVEFGASLDEDLARRDFTINAMAYSPSRGVLHDPFGGQRDIARRVIRAVGQPADRMREDRLRALRALRFAARFEFEIEVETWRAIVGSAPFLTRLSPERVREELAKTMEQVARPSLALGRWRDSGAIAVLVPVLADIDATTLTTLDCLPAPARTEGMGPRAIARADARRAARLAALFVGRRGDRVRRALRDLRFSNAETEWIGGIGDGWNRVVGTIERSLVSGAVPSDADVRRWVAAAGPTRIATVLRVAAARWAATRAARGDAGAPTARDVRALYRRTVRSAYRDALRVGDLAIDGDDLIAAGIAPGPRIGEILKWLVTAVIADPTLNDRDRLLALAQDWRPEAR